jgi:hypothetical protein
MMAYRRRQLHGRENHSSLPLSACRAAGRRLLRVTGLRAVCTRRDVQWHRLASHRSREEEKGEREIDTVSRRATTAVVTKISLALYKGTLTKNRNCTLFL